METSTEIFSQNELVAKCLILIFSYSAEIFAKTATKPVMLTVVMVIQIHTSTSISATECVPNPVRSNVIRYELFAVSKASMTPVNSPS